MNTRRNNFRKDEEENVNEAVPPKVPQSCQALIEEGVMSNVDIRVANNIFTLKC